ncbi:MAG: hypothetical protein HY764_02550 [Candidatus Portnoybacteria bacterium]|nr:hypothetical protein [Candidatus Portnoybacteria bacterium]
MEKLTGQKCIICGGASKADSVCENCRDLKKVALYCANCGRVRPARYDIKKVEGILGRKLQKGDVIRATYCVRCRSSEEGEAKKFVIYPMKK